MKTIVVKVDPVRPDAEAIRRAAEVIRGGGLVAFPTETVYGLAADALNEDAARRVYEAKGRPAGKPLPVQVARVEDVARLVDGIPDAARRLMDAFFPGPLTIVLKASPGLSPIVTAGGDTVGIRMPDHPVALALIRAFGGPIVAPSANLSDQPSPVTADEALAYLDGRIEMVLDAGESEIGVASTVVDMTGESLRIIRRGSVDEEALTKAIAD